MKEADYTRELNNRLPSGYTALKLSLRFRNGVSDCVYHSPDGVSAWLEHKYDKKIPLTINLTTKKYLTQLQMDFLLDLHQRNHRTGVIYGSPKGGILIPTPQWQEKFKRDAFLAQAKPYAALAQEIVNFLRL